MSLTVKFKRQIDEIEKTLYGIRKEIEIFVLSKIADLTILLLGEHAIAKSGLARAWSKTTGLDLRIVTSSEVEESLLAYIDPSVFRKENRVQMKRGELMLRDHLLIDEFFLWSNKYRAKLHQLLEEKSYAGLSVLTKTYTFASNPLTEFYSGQIEDLNWATLDRIDILLPMYQPKNFATQKMMKKFSKYGRKEVELREIVSWEDYLRAREEVLKVDLPSDIIVWLTLLAESMSSCKYTDSKFDISQAKMQHLCAECNQKEHLCSKVALSKPRFLRATILLSKALAWFKGKEIVTEEEVLEAIKYTLPHRLVYLRGEKTIFEIAKLLPDLIQEFIDDFNNWEARGIFRKLETIIKKAKDLEKPVFEQEIANELLSETSEHVAINNYVKEAVERVKSLVKRRYEEILKEKDSSSVIEMKEILAQSGLDIYDKGEILDRIIASNQKLTFYYPLKERNSKNLKKLVRAIRKIHREEGTSVITEGKMMKQFERKIDFFSDLLIVREEVEKVRITASTPEIKERIRKLLRV